MDRSSSSVPNERSPHASLNDTIQGRILALIRDESLQPGARMPSETSLATRLQVSRAALREGLCAMEGAGYVESRTGSGWYVKEFSFKAVAEAMAYTLSLDQNALQDLTELRALLETNLLEAAISTLTPDDLDALEQAADEMELLASTAGPPSPGQIISSIASYSLDSIIKWSSVYWTSFGSCMSVFRPAMMKWAIRSPRRANIA